METGPRLDLEHAFEECPGKWVAVDRRTGEVIAADDNPYTLAAKAKENGLRNIAIVRAPSEDQPELVGFG